MAIEDVTAADPRGCQVEFGDLGVCHGEPEHAQRLVSGAVQRSGRAVDVISGIPGKALVGSDGRT